LSGRINSANQRKWGNVKCKKFNTRRSASCAAVQTANSVMRSHMSHLHSVTAESNRPWNTLSTCVRSQN